MKLQFLLSTALAVYPLFVSGSPANYSPNPCRGNPALHVVEALHASSFCSKVLHYTQRTVRETCTVTTTVPRTVPVALIKTIPYTKTQSTTVSQEDLRFESVPGPSVTITSRPTETVSVTATSSFTATETVTNTVIEYQKNMRRDMVLDDAAAERERQLENLGVLERRELDERSYLATPGPLRKYSSAQVSQACKCYVSPPKPKTVKVTSTVTKTTVRKKTETRTASKLDGTAYVSVTQTYTTTETTTLPGLTETQTISETQTVTNLESVTETASVTATVTIDSNPFTLQFQGSGCVQNKYTHYDLVNEAYSTNERLFQVCAARCSVYGADCGSFFAYQDNDYPYQWCIIDSDPYDPAYRQCNIPFSGADLAYNAPDPIF